MLLNYTDLFLYTNWVLSFTRNCTNDRILHHTHTVCSNTNFIELLRLVEIYFCFEVVCVVVLGCSQPLAPFILRRFSLSENRPHLSGGSQDSSEFSEIGICCVHGSFASQFTLIKCRSLAFEKRVSCWKVYGVLSLSNWHGFCGPQLSRFVLSSGRLEHISCVSQSAFKLISCFTSVEFSLFKNW